MLKRIGSIILATVIFAGLFSAFSFAASSVNSQDNKVSVEINDNIAVITLIDDDLTENSQYYWKREGNEESSEILSYSTWTIDYYIGSSLFRTTVSISGDDNEGNGPYKGTGKEIVSGYTSIKDAHVCTNVKLNQSSSFIYVFDNDTTFNVTGNTMTITIDANELRTAGQGGSLGTVTYSIRHYGPQSETVIDKMVDGIKNFFYSIANFFSGLFAF